MTCILRVVQAVKTVYEQLEGIMECPMQLSTNNDPEMYTDASYLIDLILHFDFFFGLWFLRVILINTSNLSCYFQGKQADIFSLRKNVQKNYR